MTTFESLSDNSRVWIFTLSQPLPAGEAEELLTAAREFAATWKAHQKPVVAEAELVDSQFLVIAADLDRSEVSGCSIDALHRTVTELSGRFGVELVTPRDVVYRRGEKWVRVPRAEFAALAQRGEVDLSTPVLDATVVHLDQIRAGRWRPAAAESWHKAAFFS